MTPIRASILAALAASAAVLAPTAHADDGWILRAGATMIDPKSDNLKLSPTTVVEVDNKVGFTFDITKMWTPHWGTELLLAWPFKHDIDLITNGNKAAFGDTKHLPPTLSMVYQFNPNGRFRPYLTAGWNLTLFSNESPSTLNLSTSNGPAFGGGLDIGMGDKMLLNFAVKYIDIDTHAKLLGSSLGMVNIDPMVYSLNLGWRFGRPVPVVAAAPVAAPPPAPAPAPAPPPPPPKPVDSDGDGVPDGTDACPNTPPGTRVGPMGCPCDLTVQLQFKFNSAELTDADKARLDETAANMKRLNWISGVIEGHTDSTGPDAFNQTLSERRANTVREYLISKGVGDARMTAVGFGESKPVADNATKEGRAENRRVVMRRTDCDNK